MASVVRWRRGGRRRQGCRRGGATGCGRVGRSPPIGRSRHYPSTDCGIVAEMDAHWDPGLDDPFEEAIDEALSSLPADLRAAISNLAIVVEDEPPAWGGQLLGLYGGVPLPHRGWRSSGI